MRMSVPVDTETMKVCEAADDKASSPKDNVATKSEAADQSQSSKDVHGSSNNKRDVQVKIDKNAFTLKSGAAYPVTTTSRNVALHWRLN